MNCSQESDEMKSIALRKLATKRADKKRYHKNKRQKLEECAVAEKEEMDAHFWSMAAGLFDEGYDAQTKLHSWAPHPDQPPKKSRR